MENSLEESDDSYIKNYKIHTMSVIKEAMDFNKTFRLKRFDQNIFLCNDENRHEVVVNDINGKGSNIVTVKNIYRFPLAIRNFIRESPHVLNKQSNRSSYPGYISANDVVDLTNLSKIVKKLCIKYFQKFGVFLKNYSWIKNPIKFQSAIYTSSDITVENSCLQRHTDDIEGIAGVIYFNLEHEYNGGTSFYKKIGSKYEKIYSNPMIFNTMILYPSNLMHNIDIDFDKDENPFSEYYRITQRFFISFDRYVQKK